MGKVLRTSLDFYFRRNRRFCDWRQIYANSHGFRLLHFKISKKFRKDRIDTTFYIIEVKGCCYISVSFLKYLLYVVIFYRIFKMDDFIYIHIINIGWEGESRQLIASQIRIAQSIGYARSYPLKSELIVD